MIEIGLSHRIQKLSLFVQLDDLVTQLASENKMLGARRIWLNQLEARHKDPLRQKYY